MAGLSQGGGMAARIGHVHLTARVVMFGSITDAVGPVTGPSPAWVARPSATPVDRYFGFAHMRDLFWPAEQKNWAALSLNQFGPIVDVDSATPPFGGSHTLTTDIPSLASAAGPESTVLEVELLTDWGDGILGPLERSPLELAIVHWRPAR